MDRKDVFCLSKGAWRHCANKGLSQAGCQNKSPWTSRLHQWLGIHLQRNRAHAPPSTVLLLHAGGHIMPLPAGIELSRYPEQTANSHARTALLWSLCGSAGQSGKLQSGHSTGICILYSPWVRKYSVLQQAETIPFLCNYRQLCKFCTSSGSRTTYQQALKYS